MGVDFNKLKSDFISAGKEIGNKVSDVSSAAKMKMDIHAKEDYIEKQFTELGRAYYTVHKNDEEIPEKEFFKSIAEAEEELAHMKEELLTLEGAQICPGCGAKQQKNNAFCNCCGEKLK